MCAAPSQNFISKSISPRLSNVVFVVIVVVKAAIYVVVAAISGTIS